MSIKLAAGLALIGAASAAQTQVTQTFDGRSFDMIKIAATDYSNFVQVVPAHGAVADAAPQLFPPQITYFESGEKLTYQVNIPVAGEYEFFTNAAVKNGVHQVEFKVDALPAQTVTLPGTGAYNAFKTGFSGRVTLTAGAHTMTVTNTSPVPMTYSNLAEVGLALIETTSVNDAGNYVVRREGEDYLSYTGESTIGNKGLVYRYTGDGDVCANLPTIGGYQLCYFDATESYTYEVDIPKTDVYRFDISMACGKKGTGQMVVKVNGVAYNLTPVMSLDWNTFYTVSQAGLNLKAGKNTITLQPTLAQINVDYFQFVGTAVVPKPAATAPWATTTAAPVTTVATVATEVPTTTVAVTDTPTFPVEETTEAPTDAATEAPTEAPTDAATEAPTDAATEAATEAPTEDVTDAPTAEEGSVTDTTSKPTLRASAPVNAAGSFSASFAMQALIAVAVIAFMM